MDAIVSQTLLGCHLIIFTLYIKDKKVLEMSLNCCNPTPLQTAISRLHSLIITGGKDYYGN